MTTNRKDAADPPAGSEEFLGDDHVDRAESGKTEFTADFQEFIIRYAWGEVWDRPDLPRRDRSIATLVALRAENEIATASTNSSTWHQAIEAPSS